MIFRTSALVMYIIFWLSKPISLSKFLKFKATHKEVYGLVKLKEKSCVYYTLIIFIKTFSESMVQHPKIKSGLLDLNKNIMLMILL